MRLSSSSKVFLAFLVVVVGLGFSSVEIVNRALGEDIEPGIPVEIEIPLGTSASGVADILADEDVVDSEAGFRALLRIDERGSQIQAGTYRLETGMSADAALGLLAEGPINPDVWVVTIPEGLTVPGTLERIAAAEGSPVDVAALEAALGEVTLPAWVPAADELPDDAQRFEGLLFPLTYEFTDETTAAAILQTLVDQTDAIVGELATPDGGGPYEVLTVASLIEREVRVADERGTVAAVIYNRLDRPMRLQIDATVQYATDKSGERVTFEDTDVDSPWNTYASDGLPPTPIAGAGRAAIDAAIDPATADDLFYVVCDIEEGRHVFTSSNDEHNRNVAAYRRLRDGQGDPFCEA